MCSSGSHLVGMVVKALPPPVTFAIAIILFESTHEAKGSGWHYTFFREVGKR